MVWLISIGGSTTVEMNGCSKGLYVGILNITALMEVGIATACLICWYLVLAYLVWHIERNVTPLRLTLITVLIISKHCRIV
jgi:hypothetical protein